MNSWLLKLTSYGKLVYESGGQLRLMVIKRYGKRKWKIYIERESEHGEDEVVEDD